MKKTFRAIVIAALAFIALIACSKEADPVEAGKMGKGKIGVSVCALMAELTPAEGETKASVASVVRLTWENTDTVSALCGSEYLGHLEVSVSDDNKMIAKLSGEITAPTSGTTITLIHSNIEPTVSGNTVLVDLSDQKTTANPFVVYGTLEYTGVTITGQTVPFKFATSLMFVTITGLDNSSIDSVMVSGINTVCQIAVQTNGEPSIAGTTPEIITTKVDESNRSGERAIFNIGIVKDDNTDRKISAVQRGTKFEADFTAEALKESASYISVYALKEVIDYVVMKMGADGSGTLKWATKNLGAKTVAGSGETCYGHYYAWGETTPYYSTGTWDSTDKKWIFNTWNTGKDNGYGWKSYCETDTDSFTEWKPAPYDATNTILKAAKDVAKVKFGDGWRMPTSQEFKDLYDACGGTETPKQNGSTSTTEKGVYLCTSYDGVAGLLFIAENNGPHLFFPAAGYGVETDLRNAGSFGYYWSSSLYTDKHDFAYYLYFYRSYVNPQSYSLHLDPQNCTDRYCGFSVRPVKD